VRDFGNLPRQITFTGKDGCFELARPVSDSATLCRPFVTDGAMVTLEMFDGRAYRLVRHGHPDSIAAPGAERAAAIARGLQDAFQAVKLDPARWTPPPVTFHIAGTVRDSAGRPISGARVAVPALPFSVRTAADGGFGFPSNASIGEFGFAVQLDLSSRILGVATW